MNDRLPWFPCYPSKLLGAFAGMKPDEGYVYWVVCLRIYEVGGPCRDTLDALARRTGMSRKRVSDALELSFQASRLVKDGDGIMNPFAASILEETTALCEKRAHAGKKGAETRWGKDKEKQHQSIGKANGSANREPMANDGHLHLHLHKQEQEKKEISSLRSESSDWPSDFREQFWAKYPRKTGKVAAIRKLEGVRKAGKVKFPDLLSAVEKYAQSGTDPKYIKHPETWLNKGCWDDEVGQLNLSRSTRPDV